MAVASISKEGMKKREGKGKKKGDGVKKDADGRGEEGKVRLVVVLSSSFPCVVCV